ISAPYCRAWTDQGVEVKCKLNFDAPGGAFSAYVYAALLIAGAIAVPMIFYQVWAFVAPGLYAREKKVVIPFVLLSTLLFVGGGYFGWLAAFPIAFNYFLGFSG